MPAARFLGQFDRVHVGASCPPDRLAPLLGVLRPEGGLIVVPVSPNDLRVITKKPDGSVTQKVGWGSACGQRNWAVAEAKAMDHSPLCCCEERGVC